MKKLLMFFTLMIGLMSCGSGDNTPAAKSPEKDRVEVMYFHGKQRCATCMAIEKNAKVVVNTLFADELKNGTVVFKTVDLSTPEGEKVADIYEVTWSSLFVNKWKDGKETRSNLTEFGFANARNNPEGFKKCLADKIRQSL
ncbi:MAG: thioredoxin [Bacteroidales bacterium 52_46]|nr:MAG: thioredoxin [Bacteroidales bacterium 52_46]